MRLTKGAIAVAFFAFATLVGCTGPKGDTGPMGPSGAKAPNSTPIYTFKENFDEAYYNGQNYWGTVGFNAIPYYGQDSSAYVSPSYSLKLETMAAQWGSALFTNPGLVPYSASYGDYYCDFYLDPTGQVTSGKQIEFVVATGTQVLMAIGYNCGTASSYYCYQNGGTVTFGVAASSPLFRHFTMVYHSSTGLSSYYDNGVLVLDGLNSVHTISSTYTYGWPTSSWFGFVFPVGMMPTDYFNLDSLALYHY
jgi:hypothetical protein